MPKVCSFFSSGLAVGHWYCTFLYAQSRSNFRPACWLTFNGKIQLYRALEKIKIKNQITKFHLLDMPHASQIRALEVVLNPWLTKALWKRQFGQKDPTFHEFHHHANQGFFQIGYSSIAVETWAFFSCTFKFLAVPFSLKLKSKKKEPLRVSHIPQFSLPPM